MNEMIFYAGLMLIGLAVLLAAIAIPILILTGLNIRKQLDVEYGENPNKKKTSMAGR